MSVQNATLLIGGTVSATGGTSTAFVPNGAQVNSGVQVVDSTDSNAVTRASITCQNVKIPAIDPTTGKYPGKIRRRGTVTRPKVLSDGRVVFQLARIEIEYHPEASDAEITALMSQGAQLLCDSDFTSFWKVGSLA